MTPEARHPLNMAPPAVRALATRYLFDSGFVRTNGDHRARGFFWHDISVRRSEDSYEEHHSCTVKRPDGAKMELAFPKGYWRAVDVIELGREISRRIAAAQAPQALAAVRNGRTVRFGRLAVDGNGLWIGLHHIPWNHIVDVNFTGDEVVVQTTHRFLGRRRRSAMAVSNASVLAAVADVLKSAP